MNLPRWSLRYPVTAGMMFLSVVVVGALATPRLPQAFLPEVDFPSLEIHIPYPNALPAQVEEEITRPAEEALATLSRVRRLQSWSSASEAVIAVQFDWGEDIGPLRVEAREKLDRIRDQLPADVDHILINSFRSSDIPVLECRIAADRDLSRGYELLDRHVADPLRRVPGVAKVELYGVDAPHIEIELRVADLLRHQLDAGAVLVRLDASNRSLSAGVLRQAHEAWPLRVSNQFASFEEIENFPVDGRGLRLRDIATVRYREPELDYGRHLDDARAVGLNVMKESGANTVQVAARARKALRDIAADPRLAGIQVLTFTDQGEEISNSLRGLFESGLIGALLAIIVLWLFLRRLQTVLVVALAIPFSLLAAMALLYFGGRSLNILSMMGLMLAVGMLVDNAVVVLESITRHRERGRSPVRAALAGSREVVPAVVASTLCSVIVFLPLVLGGRTEITTWIGEVGRTIIFALACSLFLSLTAIPLAMGRILSTRAAPPSRAIESLGVRYQRVLGWTLRHRLATMLAGLAVLVTALLPFAKVSKSTFAGTRVEAVTMEYDFSDNLNKDEVEKVVSKVERWIQARKDSLHVKSTYSYFASNEARTRAYLVRGWADDEGAEGLRKQLRERLPGLPGVAVRLLGESEDSAPSRLSVQLFGEPGPRLDGVAEEVRRRLAAVPGLHDVIVGGRKGQAEVEVVVNRDRAERYGLSTAGVGQSVAMFFRGRPLSRFRGPDGEVQVDARLAQSDRSSLQQLERLPLEGRHGERVPLGAVASFRDAKTPASVERQQRRSVITVSGNCDAKQSGDIRKAVTRELGALSFPTGTGWSFGSAFENENATQQEMLVNLLLALVLVYLVMAALFESLLHPFAIMFALPFAFVGIAWISFLTGSPFNLMAQIGLLILIGIVVNNGIVLLYHVHHLRTSGRGRFEALMGAARDRLRPILMTTSTTILGLLPLAMGQNRVGDVLYFPLARTVIGGLAAATLLTLILVPCLYTLIEDGAGLVQRVWRSGLRAR